MTQNVLLANEAEKNKGTKKEKEVLTILSIRDETSGAIESIAVPEKGPADYAVKAAARAMAPSMFGVPASNLNGNSL